ncbi:MAG: DUF2029 domain-containing protein [Anaerolineaceae bacterium]|nr:DUF2029 domain-containing protein [Anaerolineaceae bacterium]MCB9098293.1 DUF2029 domain-containing protein [Anaerolineales bacterium]
MIPSTRRSSGYSKNFDFSLILILFVTSRLMLLLAFPIDSLIVYGDYQHYFNVASLSQVGGCIFATGASAPCFPYLDYWYEFPPIFAYLNIGVFYLAGGQFKNYIILLGFVLLIAEAGNLILLYRLAGIVYGPARAVNIAWIYTALFVPIFFWLGNFDALTTFFILLALYALTQSKSKWLALALGLGTMVKFLPAMLLATVWRMKGIKRMLGYTAATVLISLVIFAPFALINPEQTLASLRAQAGKSSYQTVWAIIDGNDATGNFGPLIDHFNSATAGQPINNPARLPTWLTIIPFGLLGVFVFMRPQTLTDPNLDAVIFTTLTFVIFFLWSQGWSPQWQTFLIPLLLLSFKEKRAVLFIIVLGFINFLEWPVILSRGLTPLLPITIAARTLVLILLGVELYQKLTASKEAVP